MERKTMGAFIAALRKAHGMTQKDLAEKLNVSDKSVSRWERDDGAPDLSLIPVIAEVFGVTCDELLRGERKPAVDREETTEEKSASPRSEKQKQRLLAVSLTKYKTRSFIAIGLAVMGLIAAFAGNFGFYRAYIGFSVGAVFYLAAVVCQAAFVNGAFLSVSDGELNGRETDRFKCSVVRMAEGTIGLVIVLLAFSLPLVTYAWDAYMGLSAETWLSIGGIFAVITLVIYCVVCFFLNHSLFKKGAYPLSEAEEQVWRHNRKWVRRCTVGLMIAFAATFGVHMTVTNIWNSIDLSEKIVFDDVDSFVEFMEQDVPYYSYVEYYSTAEEQAAPSTQIGETTYFDEFGNVISEEEAKREELINRNGNVVCEYIRRNESVASIRHGSGEDGVLPIEVVTQDAYRIGQVKHDIINTSFFVLYFAEVVAAFLIYVRKRTK